MKGISDAWIELGNRRFIPFQKLSPGKYELTIRGSNNDGIWSDELISLKIEVYPPWWLSIWAYLVYFLLVVLAVYFLIKAREKQLKHERDVLEAKVIERTEEINAQKDEIQTKNNSITASINYASKIQKAVLPQYENFKRFFPQNIMLFKPRDIVSGDFFWFSELEVNDEEGKTKNVCVIIAADSTGHGVPGAFVTVIGNNVLDDIVNQRKIYKPHEILYHLDKKITRIFKQEDDKISVNDGMDISIITYDKQANTINFAGAKNPLCLIRNGELELIKGSRSSIGGYFAKKKEFESHEFEIVSGDVFYIFSDGYQDQFGGNRKNKFMAVNFRSLLHEIHSESCEKQVEILENRFTEWKGLLSQTDDIIVLGLKF